MFHNAVDSKIDAGKAMLELNKHLPKKPTIFETSSMSTDSYTNLLKIGKNKDWKSSFEGFSALNDSNKNVNFLDDLLKWKNRGANAAFVSEKTAIEAQRRMNSYLNKLGYDESANILQRNGEWQMEIPNYRVQRNYQQGGYMSIAGASYLATQGQEESKKLQQGGYINQNTNMSRYAQGGYLNNSSSIQTNNMNNKQLISQFKLPGYIAGMSFADASKKIDGKFKDRNDLISKRTKEELLNRLSQAQEYVKAQEEQSQIPQEKQQFSEGGWYDNNQSFFTNNPGPVTGPQQGTSMQSSSGTFGSIMGGMGSMMGNSMGDNGYSEKYNYNPKMKQTYQQLEGVKDSIAPIFGPFGQMARGVEKAGKGIGTAIGGETGGDIAAGIVDPFSGQMEVFQSKESTDMEKIGAVAAPFLSGLIASRGRKKARTEASSQNAFNVNNVFRDKKYAALGGPLEEGTLDDNTLTADLVKQYRNKNMFPKPALINDSELMQPIYDSFGNLTTIGTLNTTVLTKFPKPRLVTNDSESMQPVYDKSGALTTVGTMNASVPATSSKSNLFSNLSKIGNYTKQNITGESLRYAPVVMNALQLSKLKGPEHESLQRLTNTYQPQYMDEASIQNSINSENRNTINALTNASGGSESALRAGILGAGLNATKAKSDAYMKMREYNNNQNIAKQQFQLGIDQTNLGQSNMENDINARNKGNYETQKSKLLAQIGTDLGGIGKEELFKKYPKMMGLGYDWNGKYFVNTKTGDIKTEKEAAAAESTTKKAKGGFLSNKSLTYLNSLNKK